MVRRTIPCARIAAPRSRKRSGSIMPRRETIGIAEVAAEAGVSTATVSRALSRPGEVKAETREQVLAVVRRLGYTPNLAGRSLRAARSGMVLVVIPRGVTPFFTALLLGVEQELAARGYGLLFGSRHDDEAREVQLFRLAASGAADGILLLDGQTLRQGSRSVEELGFPVVAVSVPAPDGSLPCVLVNDRAAAAEVARHLHGLGHRRFGYVGGRAGGYPDRERWLGYRDALATLGVATGTVLRIEGNFGSASGIAAAGRILELEPERRPTAVFAASDMMAIGAIHRFREAGLAVPGDVSVVGFDGIEFADLCDPVLTTVRQPREEMGRAAAALLCRALAGEAIGPAEHTRTFDASLRIGASSGPPPAYAVRRGRRVRAVVS